MPRRAPPTWSCHPPPVVISCSTARTALKASLALGQAIGGRDLVCAAALSSRCFVLAATAAAAALVSFSFASFSFLSASAFFASASAFLAASSDSPSPSPPSSSPVASSVVVAVAGTGTTTGSAGTGDQGGTTTADLPAHVASPTDGRHSHPVLSSCNA